MEDYIKYSVLRDLYSRMAGTPYRFQLGRPDKMLIKNEFSDVDVNPDVSGSVGTFTLMPCLVERSVSCNYGLVHEGTCVGLKSFEPLRHKG